MMEQHQHIFRIGYWVIGEHYSPHIQIDQPEPLAPITLDWPLIIFETTDEVMDYCMMVLQNLTKAVDGTLYEVSFN